jgi:hypothetical protein
VDEQHKSKLLEDEMSNALAQVAHLQATIDEERRLYTEEQEKNKALQEDVTISLAEVSNLHTLLENENRLTTTHTEEYELLQERLATSQHTIHSLRVRLMELIVVTGGNEEDIDAVQIIVDKVKALRASSESSQEKCTLLSSQMLHLQTELDAKYTEINRLNEVIPCLSCIIIHES